MEGQSVTTVMVRKAMQGFGANGQEISHAQLFDALGLKNETEKCRMRTRINDMIAHGEAQRIRPGVYIYNFKHRPRETPTYTVVWRFIRKTKPGWTINECALMTRVSYTQSSRYCSWLEEQGFVERVGKNNKNAVTYRATSKADANPETPYPPLRESNPFEKECVAACTISRLMMCTDPYSRKTARGIVDACRVLLARFENTVTQIENVENKETPHVV